MKLMMTPRSLNALLKDRPTGRVIVRDQSPLSPPGFVLRLSPTAANFYTIAKKRWHLVGDAKALSLEEARRVARVLIGKVAEGKDPTDERRADRQRRKAATVARREQRKAVSGPTLVGLIRRSLEAKEDRLSSRTITEWTRTLTRDISPSTIGQTQASALKRDELAAWLRDLAEHGGKHQADRVLNLTRAAYRFALDEEAAGHGYGILRDPTRGLRPQVARTELIRSRSLIADTPSERAAFDELIRWWRLTELLGLVDRVFARLIVLTGTRRTETKGARWADVDLEGVPGDGTPPTWRIAASRRKGGEHGRSSAITIPLSTLAVAELRELRAARPADTRVFENLKANPGERLHKVTIPGVSLHDLRRTTGDVLSRLGASNEERALVLGHAHAKGVERHYSFARPLALHHRWLQALADAIARHLGETEGKLLPAADRFGA